MADKLIRTISELRYKKLQYCCLSCGKVVIGLKYHITRNHKISMVEYLRLFPEYQEFLDETKNLLTQRKAGKKATAQFSPNKGITKPKKKQSKYGDKKKKQVSVKPRKPRLLGKKSLRETSLVWQTEEPKQSETQNQNGNTETTKTS